MPISEDQKSNKQEQTFVSLGDSEDLEIEWAIRRTHWMRKGNWPGSYRRDPRRRTFPQLGKRECERVR